MYRAEIIANQSVQDDLIELLEETLPDVLYTITPSVMGRGSKDRKLGSTTWPEMNFLLFAYIDNKDVKLVKAVVQTVKNKFPDEGIKVFFVKSEE
jgi:hypothetical protein